MNETKIVQCLIICCMMMSGASLLVDINSTQIDDEKNEKQHVTNSNNDGENWKDAMGNPASQTTYFTHSIGGLPFDSQNNMYHMNASNATTNFASFTIDVNGFDLLAGDESYLVHFQLWGLHEVGSSDPIRIKHGLSERETLSTAVLGGNDTVQRTVLMKYVYDFNVLERRPTGCYWVEYHVSRVNLEMTDDRPEQYPSAVSSRINFAESNQLECPLTNLWSDNEPNGGDGYDDDSYTAGQNSVDITSDNPSCNWVAYFWNGTDCVRIVDPTADNPDCNWTTHTWNGTDCIDLVDITSDNPDCNWDTHTWNGQNCVEIVDITSDNAAAIAGAMPDCNWTIQTWNGTDCIDLADTPSDTPNCNWDTQTWNGQECIEKCRENDTPSNEPINPGKEDDDDIDITGSGDAADLTVIGGAALLAGIGIATLLGQTGKGPNMGGDNKKPNIDMDDIVDVIDDLDIDLDADLDLDKPDIAKEKSRSFGGSDQYFKSGVERQKAMTDSGDPLLDDYIEDEPED